MDLTACTLLHTPNRMKKAHSTCLRTYLMKYLWHLLQRSCIPHHTRVPTYLASSNEISYRDHPRIPSQASMIVPHNPPPNFPGLGFTTP